MKVDRVRANHSLRLTASQGTPNIPFHWFQLLGSSPPGTEEKNEKDLAVDPEEETNECDQASVGIIIFSCERIANR